MHTNWSLSPDNAEISKNREDNRDVKDQWTQRKIEKTMDREVKDQWKIGKPIDREVKDQWNQKTKEK